MQQQADADRGLFSLNEHDAAEVRERIASGDPFAGEPDPYIMKHLLRRTEVDERSALFIIDGLRARWRATQADGAVAVPRGVGSQDGRSLVVLGASALEDVAAGRPLTVPWTEALLSLVMDDAPGEWFDRVVTTLAENPTLPANCRGALVKAARRTDLSGYHPHMMGPDYALLLSRVPYAVATHPAPMTAELLDVLLTERLEDELRQLLLHRPDLTDPQRALVTEYGRG